MFSQTDKDEILIIDTFILIYCNVFCLVQSLMCLTSHNLQLRSSSQSITNSISPGSHIHRVKDAIQPHSNSQSSLLQPCPQSLPQHHSLPEWANSFPSGGQVLFLQLLAFTPSKYRSRLDLLLNGLVGLLANPQTSRFLHNHSWKH